MPLAYRVGNARPRRATRDVRVHRVARAQVFISMAKALDFIDPDKLSMTVRHSP